jgi:threonine/homoserine/homoserine lactone efflux protein
MELDGIFLNSFIVGFSGAMMPGPLLAVGISETPRHGWQTGPVITVGHAIAEVGVVVVLMLGVVAVAQNSTVTQIIGIVGGAALVLMGVVMGWDTIKNKVSYDISNAQAKGKSHLLAGKGITATLSNPYWWVWWGTVGLALLVDSQQQGIKGPVVFYFGHILSDLVWYSAVSIFIWQGRKLIMGSGLRILIVACAAFLIYLGVRFFINGITA